MPAPKPPGDDNIARDGVVTLALTTVNGVKGLSHQEQALYDRLVVPRPTPSRPAVPMPYTSVDTDGDGDTTHLMAGMNVVASSTTDSFSGSAHIDVRNASALARMLTGVLGRRSNSHREIGDPHELMKSAICAGAWKHFLPPPGMSELELRMKIAMIMSAHCTPVDYGHLAKDWAVAQRGDPLCDFFGCNTRMRNQLIALAARSLHDGDKFGLSPPSSGGSHKILGRPEFNKDKVFVVHGAMKCAFTAHPGLYNMVQPRWCVRADIDTLVPGVNRASDMVGMPWATLSIHERTADRAVWTVYNPSDGEFKEKTVSLSVDPVPEWEYTPAAIESFLKEIFLATLSEKRYAEGRTYAEGKS
jgi:hypothetical protein